ncbi:hypothetical protein [Falsibacillus pallidus]|uniref:Uncharacterized protein n=1 Tax=Falsibacillus pallidus TaxID=493781 RepID=A0A370GK40_9BACI|nr:hypothetical protein [Falsibacillus pallidus]RDI44065.1 hypothetical protein DFR59_103128 [Falsibacillus pallidus]
MGKAIGSTSKKLGSSTLKRSQKAAAGVYNKGIKSMSSSKKSSTSKRVKVSS